jgi:hypothetical protein
LGATGKKLAIMEEVANEGNTTAVELAYKDVLQTINLIRISEAYLNLKLIS